MAPGSRTTLTQVLIEARRRHPEATGALNAVLHDIALACKTIARRMQFGALAEGSAAAMAQEAFRQGTEAGGHVAGLLSSAAAGPIRLPEEQPRGKYLIAFDALGGAEQAEVDGTAGSLFSVLRAPAPGRDPDAADFLQPGHAQVAAGYAIYGPATMLVLSTGDGTHGFTLEPVLGEWLLSHPRLRIAPAGRAVAVDAAHARFWEAPVKRYVDECLAGRGGPRGADFALRGVASLVAETHRVLLRGGVCLVPRELRDARPRGRVPLLAGANPVAMLVEQAGGHASTGRRRLLDLVPATSDECSALVFGAADEVARLEAYHREPTLDDYDAPLFQRRGLFAGGAS